MKRRNWLLAGIALGMCAVVLFFSIYDFSSKPQALPGQSYQFINAEGRTVTCYDRIGSAQSGCM